MLNIATLDENMAKVEGLKMVGDGAALTPYCLLIDKYDPSLMGASYDSAKKVFLDESKNIIPVAVIGGADAD